MFSEYYAMFNNLIKTNPVFAGLFSMWGLTVVTYVLRNVPLAICKFLYNQFTTTVHINNDYYDSQNGDVFNNFLKWYSTVNYKKYSRSFTITKKSDNDASIMSVGYGKHFFIREFCLFWFTIDKEENNQTTKIKEIIKITGITRNHDKINRLMKSFTSIDDGNELRVYHLRDEYWACIKNINKRDLDKVIIDHNLKSEIKGYIDEFLSSEQWYINRGISYKLSFVFEGPPGTGKTSLIKALASHYDKRVYQINISSVNNSTFVNAMTNIPKGSFVVIEDFDSSSATMSRYVVSSDDNQDKNNTNSKNTSPLSLTTILNTLDGIASLNDMVLFMTTNVINQIDPALVRPGRIDHVITIPYFKDAEIKQYIKVMFPEEEMDLDKYTFKDIAGCDVEKLFLQNKNNCIGFVNTLPVH